MVIILCVVIFTELSLGTLNSTGEAIFTYINLVLLLFFASEIVLWVFSEGMRFFFEFVNCFDSIIVYVSLGLNLSGINAKAVGILRVLRLVKVIIQMKKASDAKWAKKLMIKEEKKKQSTMQSYVEKVLDFVEW